MRPSFGISDVHFHLLKMPKGGKRRRHHKALAEAKRLKSLCVAAGIASDPAQGTSTAKVETSSADHAGHQGQEWFLAELNTLSECLSGLKCPRCTEPTLSFSLCDGEHCGFASKFALRCSSCPYENRCMSSPRDPASDSASDDYEVNQKMTAFNRIAGGNRDVLSTFGKVMGIPGMTSQKK